MDTYSYNEDEYFDLIVRDACQSYFNDTLFEDPIIELSVNVPESKELFTPIKKGDRILQWWDKDDIESNLEDLNKTGSLPTDWGTAHIKTAKMLYENRKNPEAIVSIWIEAGRLMSMKHIHLSQIYRNKTALDEYTNFISILEKK